MSLRNCTSPRILATSERLLFHSALQSSRSIPLRISGTLFSHRNIVPQQIEGIDLDHFHKTCLRICLIGGRTAEDWNESCLTLVPSHSSLITKNRSLQNPPCTYQNLPTSILLRIAASLDSVSAVCLKCTTLRSH